MGYFCLNLPPKISKYVKFSKPHSQISSIDAMTTKNRRDSVAKSRKIEGGCVELKMIVVLRLIK